jgi:hypothetical protein
MDPIDSSRKTGGAAPASAQNIAQRRERRTYASPTLIRLGTLAELTRGDVGTVDDGLSNLQPA